VHELREHYARCASLRLSVSLSLSRARARAPRDSSSGCCRRDFRAAAANSTCTRCMSTLDISSPRDSSAINEDGANVRSRRKSRFLSRKAIRSRGRDSITLELARISRLFENRNTFFLFSPVHLSSPFPFFLNRGTLERTGDSCNSVRQSRCSPRYAAASSFPAPHVA